MSKEHQRKEFEEIYRKAQIKLIPFVCRKIRTSSSKEDLQDISNEIAMDSLMVLKTNFMDKNLIKDGEHASKVLFGVAKNKIKEYIRKKIDEEWLRNLTREEGDLNLKPPSYYYGKEMSEKHREKRNARLREKYKINSSFREKILSLSKKRYKRLKSDPVKNKHLLELNKGRHKRWFQKLKLNPIKHKEYKDKLNKRQREKRVLSATTLN
jgi:hypothetical protein